MAVLSPELLLFFAGFLALGAYVVLLYSYFRFHSTLLFFIQARYDTEKKSLRGDIGISSLGHQASDIPKLLGKDHT